MNKGISWVIEVEKKSYDSYDTSLNIYKVKLHQCQRFQVKELTSRESLSRNAITCKCAKPELSFLALLNIKYKINALFYPLLLKLPGSTPERN